MTLEDFVQHYGLVAVVIGAGLEGEAAVIAGGLLAHQGLFPLWGAILAAVTGAFAADQGWFAIGRRFRERRWVAKMRARPTFARALTGLERHPIGFIFAFRFLYGLRTISPIAIGTTHVPARLFVPVNAAAVVVWAVTFSAIGYVFGREFEGLVGRLHPHGATLWWIVAGLVVVGLIVGGVVWMRRR